MIMILDLFRCIYNRTFEAIMYGHLNYLIVEKSDKEDISYRWEKRRITFDKGHFAEYDTIDNKENMIITFKMEDIRILDEPSTWKSHDRIIYSFLYRKHQKDSVIIDVYHGYKGHCELGIHECERCWVNNCYCKIFGKSCNKCTTLNHGNFDVYKRYRLQFDKIIEYITINIRWIPEFQDIKLIYMSDPIA